MSNSEIVGQKTGPSKKNKRKSKTRSHIGGILRLFRSYHAKNPTYNKILVRNSAKKYLNKIVEEMLANTHAQCVDLLRNSNIKTISVKTMSNALKILYNAKHLSELENKFPKRERSRSSTTKKKAGNSPTL